MAPHAHDSSTVLLAFGLTTCAGLATALGAALVFWGRFVAVANKAVLAACLAFSAGVMLWVSFVEIWGKTRDKWAEALPDASEGVHDAVTFGMFWVGMAVVYGLDIITHKLEACSNGGHHAVETDHHHMPSVTEERLQEAEQRALSCEASDILAVPHERLPRPHGAGAPAPPAAAEAAAADVEAVVLEEGAGKGAAEEPEIISKSSGAAAADVALQRTGILTALSIALHNFPEGLITIVATLDDPKVGVALAFAVAMHNIPEGLCVSIPIFYATGNRCKAFRLALYSGLAEIVGAALGYVVLINVLGDAAFAIMFGLVCGMMVTISLKELLPTALRYATSSRRSSGFVAAWLWAGMAVMGSSLILFKL